MNLNKIWRKLFPLKPFNQGFLPEVDGHKVFFAEFGNPEGKPVLCFHGGPGGGMNVGYLRPFNLKKYRVILFDQRGCGKSVPAGEMKDNNTEALIDDAKRILEYLKVMDKVIVRGASWGATLSLLFAEKYADLVDKIIISQVFLADNIGEDWNMKTSHLFYPDMWNKIENAVEGKKPFFEYYTDLINSDDVMKQVKAANLLGSYERVLGSIDPHLGYQELKPEDLVEIKIGLNYIHKKYFLKENQIIDQADKIKEIPMLMVHNRLDMVCPLLSAYNLHQKLPKSKLVIVPGRGHFGPQFYDAICAAIKEYLVE